jgi:hypothetical protein
LRKRQREENSAQTEAQKRQRLEGQVSNTSPVETCFMELPSDEERKRCYQEFYNATQPSKLVTNVCGVCAREVDGGQDNVFKRKIDDIPNSLRLRPIHSHCAHDLYQGLLLEPAGVSIDNNTVVVTICAHCLRELEKSCSLPPSHSLANNLWIGRIPWELANLTQPEHMLIALLYPRVFVYKLYNKSWYEPDQTNLQRGMRGTVSMYEMNIDSISSMLQGDLMPRPLEILSSIIVITFIGRGKLSLSRLRTLFQVRRRAVTDTLYWLKEHNPKYYGNIVIDHERLSRLPEDAIPVEISSTVRYSNDEALIDQESSPYVSQDDTESSDRGE